MSQSSATASRKVWKQRLLFLFQFAVTVGLLVFLFRDEEIRKNTWTVLKTADLRWVFAGLLIAGMENFLGALRWRIFVQMMGISLPFWQTVRLYFLGLFFNSFLIGSVGGDAVKVLVLIGKGSPKTASALTVVMDRLSGLGALLLVSCTFLLGNYSWLTSSPLAAGVIHFVFLYLGVVLSLLFLSFVAAWTGLSERMPAKVPFRAGLSQLCELYFLFVRRWPRTLLAAGISVFMLLGYFLIFFCSMRAYGVDLPVEKVFALMPAVDIVAALPVSLGGVGVREKVFVILLGELAGVAASVAFWVSITGFLITLFWGVLGLLTLPFFRSLLEKGKQMRELPDSNHEA